MPSDQDPRAVATTANEAGEEIVVRTNAERKRLGLATLARNASLMHAAQLQANQMAALNKRADDIDARLARRRASLTQQFVNMETAISKLQNQSSAVLATLNNLGNFSNR